MLHRYEWNARYVSAYLRQLADIRTGKTGSHTDLTMTDMKMIFTAYHADLGFCFMGADKEQNPVTAYQERDRANAACEVFAAQLEPFVSLYRTR